MVTLGIDPGLERIGFGAIRKNGSRLEAIDFGLIETPRIELTERLRLIHEQIDALIRRLEPDIIATERLLFSVNKRTAMDVAKALGVILLAAAQAGLPCVELTPPEVKLGVVGNGAADKRQVQFMVTRLLRLDEVPKPDDVADALAIAIASALRGRLN